MDHATLLGAFADQVFRQPDQIALMAKSNGRVRQWTWAGLATAALNLAESLKRQVSAQDRSPRIGYPCSNRYEDIVMMLACMIAGYVEVPFDGRLPIQQSRKRFEQNIGGLWCEPDGLATTFVDEPLTAVTKANLTAACRSIDPDSEALVLWTSGTTDNPKGVLLTHENLYGNAKAKLRAVPQSQSDTRLTSLPICHAYARTSDLGTWLISGCRLAIGLGFEAWRDLANTVRPNVANVVPSLAQRMYESDAIDLSHLQILGCGGAAISELDFARWQQRGVTIIQGYGLTETSPVISSASPTDAIAGLVGKFVDGWEHRIDSGRLFVRGPHVMKGYWNDPESTQQKIDAQGWLDTGDLVELDAASGQLRILGRADDVIVLPSGRKVHPQSVESRLNRVPGVNHSMVVFLDDRLQYWIDGDLNSITRAEIQRVSESRSAWERCESVHQFDPPLSQLNGELTAKGSLCRQVIVKQRRLRAKA